MTPTVWTGNRTAKACGDGVVEARGAKLLDEDGVGLLQRRDPLRRDLPENANQRAPARERVSRDECGSSPSSRPTLLTSSLKRSLSGLDERQAHLLGEAADVVMRLDRRRWAFTEADSIRSG